MFRNWPSNQVADVYSPPVGRNRHKSTAKHPISPNSIDNSSPVHKKAKPTSKNTTIEEKEVEEMVIEEEKQKEEEANKGKEDTTTKDKEEEDLEDEGITTLVDTFLKSKDPHPLIYSKQVHFLYSKHSLINQYDLHTTI